MNVLIVDDELMMLEMAKDTVEEVVPDSSVETSFDPCRALEKKKKKKYDDGSYNSYSNRNIYSIFT